MGNFEKPKKKAKEVVGAAFGAFMAGASPSAAEAGPKDPVFPEIHHHYTVPVTPEGIKNFKEQSEKDEAADLIRSYGMDPKEVLKKAAEIRKRAGQERNQLRKEGDLK